MNSALKAEFIELLAKEGFSIDAMRHASISLGLHPEYHNILFPSGISEALEYYEQELDAKMLDILDKIDPLPKKIREKIALAVGLRIVAGHVPSIKSAWRTADHIWRFAGDTSTDFNYYTKRGLLSGVYIAAAKYRRNDSSPNAEDTELFIAKNLDRIINIAQLKNKLPKPENVPIIRYFV